MSKEQQKVESQNQENSEVLSVANAVVRRALDELRTEIRAGRVLTPKNLRDIGWNGATDRAVQIILDKYKSHGVVAKLVDAFV